MESRSIALVLVHGNSLGALPRHLLSSITEGSPFSPRRQLGHLVPPQRRHCNIFSSSLMAVHVRAEPFRCGCCIWRPYFHPTLVLFCPGISSFAPAPLSSTNALSISPELDLSSGARTLTRSSLSRSSPLSIAPAFFPLSIRPGALNVVFLNMRPLHRHCAPYVSPAQLPRSSPG
jgi:hypothetical protein